MKVNFPYKHLFKPGVRNLWPSGLVRPSIKNIADVHMYLKYNIW